MLLKGAWWLSSSIAIAVVIFPAAIFGKYSAFCGVPGHGGSGMWLGFSVIDGIDAPFVMFNKSAMDEGYAKPLL